MKRDFNPRVARASSRSETPVASGPRLSLSQGTAATQISLVDTRASADCYSKPGVKHISYVVHPLQRMLQKQEDLEM